MSDAYSNWLDIPAHLRPPTHYQLLGIAPSELDPKAIAAAADRQLERLRTYESGPTADECRRITQEIVQARDTLLDPVARQRYDVLTPDAAQPWWKEEAAPAPSAATVPVEGWWEGEAPEPLPPPTDASEVGPANPTGPGGAPPVLEIIDPGTPIEARPSEPSAAKPEDWWKEGSLDPALNELPPPQTLPAVAPPTPTPPPPSRMVEPPPPASSPPAAPAPGPIVSEEARAFPSAAQSSGLGLFVVAGALAVVAVGAGVLYWKKPWQSSDTAPVEKPLAQRDFDLGPMPRIVAIDGDSPPAPMGGGLDAERIEIEPRVVANRPDKVVDIDPPPKKVVPTPAGPNEFTRVLTFRGHKEGSVYGLAVSRTGKTILSIGDDRNVLRYSPSEVGKHGVVHQLSSPGIAVVLCNDDRDAVICDGGETIVFDLAGRKARATFENPRGGIRSLAAAPDGSFVLTGTTDGCVRWWSVAKKELAHTFDLDERATVTAIALAPDARSAAFGLSDGRLYVWDLQKPREVKRWKAHTGRVTAVAYSPDGRRLLSGGDDAVASVWQASGGKLVQKLSGHTEPVLGVVWCSDGRRVVTAGIDKQVRMWDEEKGWKSGWSHTVTERTFCLTIDARDRFVLAGLSNGAIELVPLPQATKGSGS